MIFLRHLTAIFRRMTFLSAINRACRQKQTRREGIRLRKRSAYPSQTLRQCRRCPVPRRDNCRPPADVWYIDRSGNCEPPVSQSRMRKPVWRVIPAYRASIPNDRHSSTDAPPSTNHFPQRQFFTFAFQIPKGDIHRRHRKRRDASATHIVNMLFHKVIDIVNRSALFPWQYRGKIVIDHRFNSIPSLSAGIGISGASWTVFQRNRRGYQFEMAIMPCFASTKTSARGALKALFQRT